MTLIRIACSITPVLMLLTTVPVFSQQWPVWNDEDESFTLYLKPTDDRYARPEEHELPRGRITPVRFTTNTRYHLTLRSSGGLTYRTTKPISLDRRERTPLSRIVSPVRNKNRTIKRNKDGKIIYQVMNQDGFEQDEDYEKMVQRLMRSSWSTTYQRLEDKQPTPQGLSIDGNRGEYGRGNGQLSALAYTPDEDSETITIDGVWNWGKKERGRFYFTIDFNQPNEFKGEYWKDNDRTLYSWTGTRKPPR
jgi:hypothetical protein